MKAKYAGFAALVLVVIAGVSYLIQWGRVGPAGLFLIGAFLLGVVWLIWFVVERAGIRVSQRHPVDQPVPLVLNGATKLVVEDGDAYEFRTVGTNFKTDIIQRLLDRSDDATGKTARRVRFAQRAAVLPEPDNPYDPLALVVTIDGRPVAYIASDEVEEFRDAVIALARSEGMTVQGDQWVVITGAEIWWAEPGQYHVVLNLPDVEDWV